MFAFTFIYIQVANNGGHFLAPLVVILEQESERRGAQSPCLSLEEPQVALSCDTVDLLVHFRGLTMRRPAVSVSER